MVANGSIAQLRQVAEMFGLDASKAAVINMLKCVAAQLEDEKRAIVCEMGAVEEVADAVEVAKAQEATGNKGRINID